MTAQPFPAAQADKQTRKRASEDFTVSAGAQVERPSSLLDPGFCLTLRPMKYPVFYEMYQSAVKNTWTVEEVDFSTDIMDLRHKMTDAERHLISRLVAFFATGDTIVANNLVLNLFVESPNIGQLSSMYFYAWKKGLKTTYYLRSRPATRIAKATLDTPASVEHSPPAAATIEPNLVAAGLIPQSPVFSADSAPSPSNGSSLEAAGFIPQTSRAEQTGSKLTPTAPLVVGGEGEASGAQAWASTIEAPAFIPMSVTDADAIACSLENPETCEACQ